MDTPEHIYNLISFPLDYLEWSKERYEEEQSMLSLSEHDRILRYKARTHDPLDRRGWCGPKYRGAWLDKQTLIDVIGRDSDPYGLCEAYYDILLIEKSFIGSVDSFCWYRDDPDAETWFRASHEDGKNFLWKPIERPTYFEGVISFL